MPLREKIPSRSTVPARAHYRDYKTELRQDFSQRCGYCDTSDEFFGGERGYQIDHFAPKSQFPDLTCTYTNLVYSCPLCNRAKWNKWIGDDSSMPNNGSAGFVDPCDPAIDQHISRDGQGRIVAVTQLGEYMVFNLNLRLVRHQHVWQAQALDRLSSRLSSLRCAMGRDAPHYVALLEALVDVNAAWREYRTNALNS